MQRKQIKINSVFPYNPKPTPLMLRRKSSVDFFLNNFIESLINELPEESLFLFRSISGNAKVIAYLQYITGARAIEVLRLRVQDVAPNSIVRFKGAKNSNDRYFYIPQSYNSVKEFYDDKKLFLFSISYKQYYLALKRCGIHTIIDSNSPHCIVTHYFRHLRAQTLNNNFSFDTEVDKKQFLGHKSLNSIQHYIGGSNGRITRRYSRQVNRENR